MAKSHSLATRVLEPGEVLGARYKIIKLIGSGGMASVYLTADLSEDGKEIALKVLHKEFSEDKTHVERFIREIKLIHKIDHPNIVRTYDIRTDEGLIYFTMEYVDGESLEQLMERHGLSNSEVSKLIVSVCEGLAAIHAHDIVHRDLKPANVLLGKDGSVKIVDFGVAREKSSRLTQPNQKLGSLCYIAPEVWLGQKITPAVDFYSLGIMLYELVTGNVPFESPLPGKMLQLHLDGKFDPPASKNAKVPAWLNDLIIKLLSKSPKDRPGSAEDIIALVKKHGASDSVTKLETVSLADAQAAQIDGPITPIADRTNRARGKTYVFKITATRVLEDAASHKDERPRRRATMVINLPRNAALVLEIEAPSRDVIYFGIFLMSLQVFDAVLAYAGLPTWGMNLDGSMIMRFLTSWFGKQDAIFALKGTIILGVALATLYIKRRKLFKDMVGALSCIYLLGACSPWLFFFWSRVKHFI